MPHYEGCFVILCAIHTAIVIAMVAAWAILALMVARFEDKSGDCSHSRTIIPSVRRPYGSMETIMLVTLRLDGRDEAVSEGSSKVAK